MSDEFESPRVVDLSGRPINVTPEEENLIAMREAAIEQLEEIIEGFRQGQMNGFAMVFTMSNGGGGSVMSEEASCLPIEYLGALARIGHRINRVMDYNEDLDDEG